MTFCNGLFIPCNCSLKISRTDLCEEDLRFSQLLVMFWLKRKKCFGCSFVLNKNISRETNKVTDCVRFFDAILSNAGKKSRGSGGIHANRPRFLRIPLVWKLSGRPPGDEPVVKGSITKAFKCIISGPGQASITVLCPIKGQTVINCLMYANA